MRMAMDVDELERREPAARGWSRQVAELAIAWGVCRGEGPRRDAEVRAVKIVAARIWQMTRGQPSFAAIDVSGAHEDLLHALVGPASVARALRVVFRFYWELAQRELVSRELAAEVQASIHRLYDGEKRKAQRYDARRRR